MFQSPVSTNKFSISLMNSVSKYLSSYQRESKCIVGFLKREWLLPKIYFSSVNNIR